MSSTIPLDPRLGLLRNQTVNYYDINKYVGAEARKNLDLFYAGNFFQKEMPYSTYFKNDYPVGGIHKEYASCVPLYGNGQSPFPCDCHTKGDQYSFPHLG